MDPSRYGPNNPYNSRQMPQDMQRGYGGYPYLQRNQQSSYAPVNPNKRSRSNSADEHQEPTAKRNAIGQSQRPEMPPPYSTVQPDLGYQGQNMNMPSSFLPTAWNRQPLYWQAEPFNPYQNQQPRYDQQGFAIPPIPTSQHQKSTTKTTKTTTIVQSQPRPFNPTLPLLPPYPTLKPETTKSKKTVKKESTVIHFSPAPSSQHMPEHVYVSNGPDPKIQNILAQLKETRIRPEDLHPTMFAGTRSELEHLAENVQVLAFNAFQPLHKDMYKAEKYQGSVSEKEKKAQPGTIFTGAVFETLRDNKVSIADLNRIHSVHGEKIAKNRFCIIIRIRNRKVDYLTTTSFKGSGAPPAGRKHRYAWLAHVDDRTIPPGVFGMSEIRFTGPRHMLDRVTFVDLDDIKSMHLEDDLFGEEAQIALAEYAKISDLLRLSNTHQFRIYGQQQLAKSKETAEDKAEEAARKALAEKVFGP